MMVMPMFVVMVMDDRILLRRKFFCSFMVGVGLKIKQQEVVKYSEGWFYYSSCVDI